MGENISSSACICFLDYSLHSLRDLAKEKNIKTKFYSKIYTFSAKNRLFFSDYFKSYTQFCLISYKYFNFILHIIFLYATSEII